MPRKKSSRNPNAAGSVRRRPDGRYEARVTVGFEAGKQIQKSVYGRTEAQARAKMIELQGRVQRGAPIPRGRVPTVSQYAQAWIEHLQRRPSTIQRYRELLALHILPALGRAQVTKLERADVTAMMRRMQDAGLKNATANRARELLRNVLNDAMRDDLIVRNVAALVQPLSTSDSRASRTLDPRHVAKFMAVAADHGDGPLWLFLLGMGWRLGEALGLAWDAVDGDTVRLEQELRRDKIDGIWQYHLQDPKTAEKRPDKAKRTVVMPHFVVAALERQKRRQAEMRSDAKVWDLSFGNLVFTTRTGRPMGITDIDHRFAEALESAGLPRMRPHELRHSTSSLAAAMGVDPKLTAIVLGHANPSMTVDTYTHNTLALSRLVAEAMDRATGSQA